MAAPSDRSIFFTGGDGLRLHARVWEPEAGFDATLVCLTGLTRNTRDFEGLANRLASGDGWRVVAFDSQGRGLSQWSGDWRTYSVPVEAGDVLIGLSALGIRRAAFIGTSRGGLILHLLAASHPDVIEAAVLNDVGPELGREGLRRIQAYLSRAAPPASWPEAEAIQRAVHGETFPALSDADWKRFTRAIYRDEAARPVPDHDPALARTLDGIDWSKPLPDLWPQFARLAERPLLTLRGENSRLLEARTAEAMKRACPAMELETVPGQGHAPLLDTAGLPERIAAFLRASRHAPCAMSPSPEG